MNAGGGLLEYELRIQGSKLRGLEGGVVVTGVMAKHVD